MGTLIIAIIVIVVIGRLLSAWAKDARKLEARVARVEKGSPRRSRAAHSPDKDHRPQGQDVGDWYSFSPEERDRRIEEAISRYPAFDEHFYSKVRGVTHENPDGSSRQEIIKRCRIGELLELVPEPDNPVDKNALALRRNTREQVGYVSAEIAKELSGDISRGTCWFAMVTGLTGNYRTRHGLNIALLRVRAGETVTLPDPAMLER